MHTTEPLPLGVLYEQDETAWLEIMSHLAAEGRYAEMDHSNLSEFLADMARRDRREVFSRLVVLLSHLLREHQPEQRSRAWQATTPEQRRELRKLLESGTLRNHATSVLGEAYGEARKQAAAETGLCRDVFPSECPWKLESVLVDEEIVDDAG